MTGTSMDLGKQYTHMQIVQVLIRLFTSFKVKCGNFAKRVNTRVYSLYLRTALLDRNKLEIHQLITLMSGNLSVLRRYNLPISKELLFEKSNEIISNVLQKINSSESSAIDTIETELRALTSQLYFLNLVRNLFVLKLKFNFEWDADCLIYLSRYNLNVDNENFSERLMQTIKRLTGDIKRLEIKLNDNKPTVNNDITIEESIKKIIYVIGKNMNQTVNGHLLVNDFLIMYSTYKDEQKEMIKLQQQQHGNR